MRQALEMPRGGRTSTSRTARAGGRHAWSGTNPASSQRAGARKKSLRGDQSAEELRVPKGTKVQGCVVGWSFIFQIKDKDSINLLLKVD